jgi:hypothetical protein
VLTLHGHSGTVRALAWPDQVGERLMFFCSPALSTVLESLHISSIVLRV